MKGMKHRKWKTGLLSWMLVLSLALGMTGSVWAAPEERASQAEQEAVAQEGKLQAGQEAVPEEEKPQAEQEAVRQNTGAGDLSWTEDTGVGTGSSEAAKEVDLEEQAPYEASEQVRVFITMEGESVVDAGFSTQEIGRNTKATGFSGEVQEHQEDVLKKIEKKLGQEKVEVRYNFSMLANAVSATVAYGDIEKIKEVKGVKDVYLVPQYQVQDDADTDTAAEGEIVGSYQTWESGYTGAGERIAIIDTGIDSDHPSFAESAYMYGLGLTAEAAGKEISEYGLMDEEDISGVLDKLHASQRYEGVRADELFRSNKIAFGFNYVDWNLDITHDNDSQGDHGTHVAGIAAANQYVPKSGEGFEKQKNSVVGIAKDAQLLVMKVFGSAGGAYTDDYMAAIEDAIMLGADAVNLSLGTSNAGESVEASEAEQYVNEIFDKLSETDTVVSISAGNAGGWSDNSTYGANRTEDVNMDTIGSPGSYYNAFTVASAQNSGYTGHYVKVGDKEIFYDESGSEGEISSFAALDTSGTGTDYGYVFLDTFGEAEDYAGLDVAGKIVLVSRGVITFTEKHQNAQAAGAAGIFVYNNEPGFISMSLGDSQASIPCAMIAQEDAQIIQNQGAQGTMKVFAEVATDFNAADGYAMSDFSSWGVPGDLLLKPEITAPGGNIYSTLDGGEYGSMSGTSMAVPSVAGMSALVIEYVKENGLAEKTQLSPRTLAQSLLMSTAVPLKEEDGEEYSPRKQGSGLANVAAATTTPVYILMGEKEGDDGKVKAELGDDPSRTGEYHVVFTLYNMSERKQYYTFRSSVLTEQMIQDGYFNGSSYKLQPTVTVASSEKEYLYDLNQDGKVDSKDAAELLRYVNQSVNSDKVDYYQDKFDFHKDGIINTVDVYRFLEELEKEAPKTDLTETCLEVDETAQIDVKIVLSDADREYLDTYFQHGMYIDGFIYLDGQVPLSVPLLAFYGGWSESSMFEPFDYLEAANGGGGSWTTYSGVDVTNYLTYRFAGDLKEYYYASNMYYEEGDEEYISDRNAFCNKSGDSFGSMAYSLIRNAQSVELSVADAKTGDVYYVNQCGSRLAAYYSDTEGAWSSTITEQAALDWAGTDDKGKPLPEGTQVIISVTALPAYYNGIAEGTADGVRWEVPVSIDNTAPKAVDMSEPEPGKIQVTVKDNRYTAAVNVYERDKKTLVKSYAVNQQEPGTEETITIEYPEKVFYVKVMDYAGNETAYRVNKSGTADTEITDGVTLNRTTLRLVKGNEGKLTAIVGPDSILDDTVTWSSADETIATVNADGVVKAVGVGKTTVTAATNAKNKDGEKETASCEVTVEMVSVSLNSILWDENGSVYWTGFGSDKLDEITYLSEPQENKYMSAAVIGDKILAATFTTDGEQMSDVYLVDPADGYSAQQIGNTYWCNDMAYSPNTGLVFAAYGTYVHWFNSSDAQNQGVSDFATLTGGKSLVGIAYAGYEANSTYGPMEWFYAVSQSGELYQLGYAIEYGQFAYTDLGATGVETGEEWYFNSLYYDAASGYLFWAMYDGGSHVTLYALQDVKEQASDLSTVNTYVMGQFAEEVWPIAGLYSPADKKGRSGQASEHVIRNGRQAQLLTVPVDQIPEKKPATDVGK